jgi:tripartite-type tricarboxylate transporter receptor subunit TctC
MGILLLTGLGLQSQVQAADFPSSTVRIVVPSSPGGALDVLARLLAPRLGEKWGQSVVAENRAGANGIVGTQSVARAKPDGHTLIIFAPNFTINPCVYKQLPYKTSDFQPVTVVGYTPSIIVVHPSAKFRSFQEMVAFAKRNPGSVTYASSGVGSSGQLSMALVERLAGIKMVHVPYKGAGDATSAVMRGETLAISTAVGAAMPFIQNGSMVPIGVTTPKRSSALPDVPTLAESGLPGYDVSLWYGIFAPAGIAKDVLDKIYGDLVEVMRIPDVTRRINGLGFEVGGNTPADFARFIEDDLKRWEPTVKAAGIQAE